MLTLDLMLGFEARRTGGRDWKLSWEWVDRRGDNGIRSGRLARLLRDTESSFCRSIDSINVHRIASW